MKRRTASFGSFGALNSKFVQLFSDTKYEDDWRNLDIDFKNLEKQRLDRRDFLFDLSKSEKELAVSVKEYKSKLKDLQENIIQDKNLDLHIVSELESTFKERWKQVNDIGRSLPQEQSYLLKLVLGELNVTLPNLSDRVKYKSNYESFKLRMNVAGMVLSSFMIIFECHRIVQSLLQAFVVWYYSTVTLREHILLANGSRIRVWWMIHHYVTIFAISLILTWPDSKDYQEFIYYYHIFSSYVAFVQCMQFQYQTQGLYRLRALGKADMMDVTAEGVRLKGSLTLLIPFLLIGQIWQLYLAYQLYNSYLNGNTDWQVPHLFFSFAFLGFGNIYATVTTCARKLNPYQKRKS